MTADVQNAFHALNFQWVPYVQEMIGLVQSKGNETEVRVYNSTPTSVRSHGRFERLWCCSSFGEVLSGEDALQDAEKNAFRELIDPMPTLEKLLTSKNPEDLLKAFLQLDKAIMEEENRNPSSFFSLAMSRQQQIKGLLQSAAEVKNQNEILSGESSIYDLFEDLGLTRNFQLAAEHEEFFSSISRREINQNTINILRKMLEEVENQIKTSSGRLSQLQSAYHQQDELLGQIFGETYGNEMEKVLEKKLDTMRYYKDMLSISVLQWKVCIESIQSAVSLLKRGVTSWKSIEKEPLQKKISLATEARNCFQQAVLLIQTSEELLQDVQFPFCTARESRGVSQATDYVFTDILIKERYLHASEMYENFLQRAASLNEWIKEVFNANLHKDLLEIEEKVSGAAVQLRNERIYLICKKLKIQNPSKDLLEMNAPLRLQGSFLKTYRKETSNSKPVFDFSKFPVNLESKLGLNQDANVSVQNYFRKIVENRKNTMWPSRRIDELPSLMM